MTEASAFPQIVWNACRDMPSGGGVQMSSSSNSDVLGTSPRPESLSGGITPRQGGGGHATTPIPPLVADDDNSAFFRDAERMVQRHAMWLLGDWRAGGVPDGCHVVVGDDFRKELFCFWEAQQSIAGSKMSYLLLRMWFSRKDAREAHRALALASSRIRSLGVEAVVTVPRSALFAFHGAVVSVTELQPLLANVAHGGPAASNDDGFDLLNSWRDAIASHVLGYVPRRSIDSDTRHTFGGILRPLSETANKRLTGSLNVGIRDVLNLSAMRTESPAQQHSISSGNESLCRWMFVPAASDVFVELDAADGPSGWTSPHNGLHSTFMRRCGSSSIRRVNEDAHKQNMSSRVERLQQRLLGDSAAFGDNLGVEEYQQRSAALSAAFHQCTVNMQWVPYLRTVGALASTRGGSVRLALDERLVSRGAMALVRSRLDDVAERSARLGTQEKVQRERRAALRVLQQLLEDPARWIPRAVEAHYGAAAAENVYNSLHPLLTAPRSASLAAVLVEAARHLGLPCTATVEAAAGTDAAVASITMTTEMDLTVDGLLSSTNACTVTLVSKAGSTQSDAEGSHLSLEELFKSMKNNAGEVPPTSIALAVYLLAHRRLRGPPTKSQCREEVLLGSNTAPLCDKDEIAKDTTCACITSAVRTLTECVSMMKFSTTSSMTQRCFAYQQLRTIVKWLHVATSVVSSTPSSPQVLLLREAVVAACGVCLAWRLGHEHRLVVQPPPGATSEGFMQQHAQQLLRLAMFTHDESIDDVPHGSVKAPTILSPSTWSVCVLQKLILDAPPSLWNSESHSMLLGAVSLLAAHVAHAVPMDTQGLSLMALLLSLPASTLPLSAVEAVQSQLHLHDEGGEEEGLPQTFAFLLLQLMVELEQGDDVVAATVVGIALARWMFAGVDPLPTPIARVLADASSLLFSTPSQQMSRGAGAPSQSPGAVVRVRKALDDLSEGRSLQAHKVAVSRHVLEGSTAGPTHELLAAAAKNALPVELTATQLDGARALLVTVLVRGGDPTGLSSGAPTPRTDQGLKPQRPPLSNGGTPRKPAAPGRTVGSQQVALIQKSQTLVERVQGRWRAFSGPAARIRYAEEQLWGRVVGILSAASTISEVDAEYFLQDFALFGHVDEVSSGHDDDQHEDVQRHFGAVGKPLEDSFHEPFQRRAVLVALLLASARTVTLFYSLKPPHTTRTKDTMASVTAAVILILKLQDELISDDLEDEEPVLQSLLDIAEWLAGTGNADDRVLCRCIGLFATRELLPWSALSQSASVATVEAVMDLFYQLDEWQVDQHFTDLPEFLRLDAPTETLMLVLDSYNDDEEEYPAIRRASRILNRTLPGFQDVCTSLAVKKQRTIGVPRPPSTSVTGNKRVISANAARALLTFQPSAAFLSAEESDRTLLCEEEEALYWETILNVHKRQWPPLHERHLKYMTMSSTVDIQPEDALQHVESDVEPRRRIAMQEAWRSELQSMITDMEEIMFPPSDRSARMCFSKSGEHIDTQQQQSHSAAVVALLAVDQEEDADFALRELHAHQAAGSPFISPAGATLVAAPPAQPRSAGNEALDVHHSVYSRLSNFLDTETPFKARAASSAAEALLVKNARRQDAELRESQWAQRREVEKEEHREFLALLSAAEIDVLQLVNVPDEDKPFFSRRTPSPIQPDAAALAAIALDEATLRAPACFRIAEDEECMRLVVEDTCRTYWGVLLLEMKRCFFLKRTF